MVRKNSQPDYADAIAALKKDRHMAPLIKRHGYPDLSRYHGDISIFQSLLRSVVFQQISGSAARSIYARLVALFPDNTPTPESLLKIRAPKLRSAGLSIQKITYVKDLAKRCLDGTIEEEKFPSMSSQEIIDHLTVVKGIGVWTAQMMLIFRLHRLDVLPVGDLAVRKGMTFAYGLKKDPTPKLMEARAAPWRQYASIAAWYLWAEYSHRIQRAKKNSAGLVQ
jgi:DNA-3-methyladenine glycosylase II